MENPVFQRLYARIPRLIIPFPGWEGIKGRVKPPGFSLPPQSSPIKGEERKRRYGLPVFGDFELKEKRMAHEQRRFRRYAVKEDGFDVLSRDLKVVGKLKNISRGGVAYQYTPVNGTKPDSEMIDILGKVPDRFSLLGLDCRTVYDIATLNEDRTFTGSASRLRGLQFKGLTVEQEERLGLLLQKYAIKPSDDPEAQ
jgi:hypothetical protein